jgi:pimeloyl-ACP methyl ester carboxylesterase
MLQSIQAVAPQALEGQRCTLQHPAVGLLSWYQGLPDVLPADAASSRPLLLIHSINAAGSAYEVKPLYEHYRHRRPVYALDLPGFGLSERSVRPYTPRLMTDAILALVEQIEMAHPRQGIDALALSLSCEFLARAAVERPQPFRSIALESPTGFTGRRLRRGPAGSTLGKAAVLGVLNRPGWRRGIFDLLTRRGVIRYFLQRTWGSPAIDEGMLDYDYAITRPPGAELAPLYFLSGYLFSADSGTLYESLQPPVWAAHGVRGDFSRFPSLAPLVARQHWQLDVFPTGALPHFERLPEFLQRYESFLAALPRSAD